MTRSRSRSRPRTGVRSENSLVTHALSTIDSRYSSLREPGVFIVLKVSMGPYITPRSVYLPNDPSTTIMDVKEKIYDEIERIPLHHQQLFFLDPTRIARFESTIIPIEPLDWWQPLALYGIRDGAEIRCVKWCRDCCKKLCDCGEEFKWRHVLASGSRLVMDDFVRLLPKEEDILFDWNFPE